MTQRDRRKARRDRRQEDVPVQRNRRNEQVPDRRKRREEEVPARRSRREEEVPARRSRREEEIPAHRNAAKSVHEPDRRKKKTREKDRKRTKKEQRKMARRNRISRNVGIGLAAFQMFASILFIIAVVLLDMLPLQYMAVLFILLALLCALLFMGQFHSKKKAIAGKIISIIITIALLVGSFFIFKANATLSSIMSSGTKVDNMVVAVLIDDSAETIEDALDYEFGTQYALGAEHVQETIDVIEEDYATTLDMTEYSDMGALATALQDGSAQAIIYNESYAGVIEDVNPDYESEIKIIYTYEIVSELEMTDTAANVAVESEVFYVYISGIDVFGSITQNSRSDVNIIAEVNPTTGQILLINTPRDFYVQIPGVSGDSYDKLTHAGVYGVDTSMATLEAIYDIDIEFYARVNFTSLIEMVDALGGITVYSEYSFTTIEHAGLYPLTVSSGYNDFDGTDALIFARERLNVPGGDETRGINQQAVITAMIEKAISPAIITGASSLLSVVADNVETNMSDDQIQNLIKMQISESIDWNIESVASTGTTGSDYCYSYSGGALSIIYPDYDSVDVVKAQMQAVADGGTIADAVTTDDTSEDTSEE